jgi:hypothetical protein
VKRERKRVAENGQHLSVSAGQRALEGYPELGIGDLNNAPTFDVICGGGLSNKKEDRMSKLNALGLASAMALAMSFAAGSAEAFVGTPVGTAMDSLVTPVAMCGYTCRSGGRYIPGPPEVCYERGLEYCGSSRGSYQEPGVGVRIPGTGIGIGVGPGGGGVYVAPGGNCRTVTIERDDGSVRRIRRCD